MHAHTVSIVSLGAIIALTGASSSKCQNGVGAQGPGAYECFRKFDKAPEPYDTGTGSTWIHAILEVKCLPPQPLSHSLVLWLEIRNAAGHWATMAREEYDEVPGPVPRKKVITVPFCQSGVWRLRIVIDGLNHDGREYIDRDYVESTVSCP